MFVGIAVVGIAAVGTVAASRSINMSPHLTSYRDRKLVSHCFVSHVIHRLANEYPSLRMSDSVLSRPSTPTTLNVISK